ncbi:MAG: hypothetical protein V7638_745 [Acidobacteriota bacterium]|jgi:hypothetical protein
MRSLIVGIWFLIVLGSCGTKTIDPHSIEGKLVTRIKTTCGQSGSCTVRLRDVTNFAWDRVYVFKTNARQYQIEEVIGVPFPQYEEFKRSMIFLKEGELVHGEAEPTDVEAPIDNQVIFDIPDTDSYRSYLPESQFNVTRKSYDGRGYYKLNLIEN